MLPPPPLLLSLSLLLFLIQILHLSIVYPTLLSILLVYLFFASHLASQTFDIQCFDPLKIDDDNDVASDRLDSSVLPPHSLAHSFHSHYRVLVWLPLNAVCLVTVAFSYLMRVSHLDKLVALVYHTITQLTASPIS